MTTSPAIVFIGFMGAGKSTALEAARVGAGDGETDELMERELGMPIARVLRARWARRRSGAREAEMAGALLERADGGAIALGGGTVLSERVRPGAAAGIPSSGSTWTPIPRGSAFRTAIRPLARERTRFDALLADRKPLYEALADASSRGATRRWSPGRCRRSRRWRSCRSGTRLLWAGSASGEYPVFVGPGLLDAGWWPLESRRFCITDTAVGALYADRLEPLEARIEVAPGEGAKTMAEAERVLRELARAGMTREDHVVALGGGVVGDLAGFCAHTYQRGVPVVQVPTSLVAQVDSAYGGKTGVDLPEGKNYAGAYHLPAAVIADTATLASLPARGAGGGLRRGAEDGAAGRRRALGAGADDRVAGRRRARRRRLRLRPPQVRGGRRRRARRAVCAPSLNLGHTVGHAIEAASGYSRYRHGEAIGLGLLAALRLSEAPELRDEVEAILRRHGLPVDARPGDRRRRDARGALQRDKKRTAAGVGFVLLAEPGEPPTRAGPRSG